MGLSDIRLDSRFDKAVHRWDTFDSSVVVDRDIVDTPDGMAHCKGIALDILAEAAGIVDTAVDMAVRRMEFAGFAAALMESRLVARWRSAAMERLNRLVMFSSHHEWWQVLVASS